MTASSFDILLDVTGLRNAVVYPFDELGEPLEPTWSEIDPQEEKGNKSQRLDTGAIVCLTRGWVCPFFAT
jgi:hypothetical protein